MTSPHFDSQTAQPRRFNTTQWSLVLRAQQVDSNDSRSAWDDLIRSYWYPLYAFSRQSGNSNDDAKDLTQGFFAHLISAEGLENVGQQRGRFRSFLLTAFKHYMVNEHHARTAMKRGGATKTVSVPDFDAIVELSARSIDFETPEQAFDRTWVHSILNRVLDRLRGEYTAANKSRLFAAIEPNLTNDAQQQSHVEIGKHLQISPAAVAMSISRLRRRYGEILYEEVAATLEDSNDVEDELRHLLEILGRRC